MPDMDGLTALEQDAGTQARAAGHHDVGPRHHRHRGEGDAAGGARLPGEAHHAAIGCCWRSRTRSSTRRVVEELQALRAEVGRFDMVGQGAAMQRIYALIQRAAPSEGRVLITGENGTGKELIARAVHQHSRGGGALREAELRRGAARADRVGAVRPREGRVHRRGRPRGGASSRLADGGTLFLDEVGDMPASMQAKLLRVLQEGELERVGGTETIKVDVRVIAATNKDLEAEIEARPLPRGSLLPLERGAAALSAAARAPRRSARADRRLPRGVLPEERPQAAAAHSRGDARMMAYDYPGNVRELRNLVERLAILCEGPLVTGAEAEALLPRGDAQRARAAALGRRDAGTAPIACWRPALPRRCPAPAGFRRGQDLPRAGRRGRA